MNGHHPIAIPVVGVTALVTALALTPTDVATIIGAIAILVGALGTAVAAIISALGRRIKEVKTDIGDVKAKVEVVEGHVNSATTKLETTNQALREQIAILKEDRAEKRQVAAVLAQSTVGVPKPVADQVDLSIPTEKLVKGEKS